MGQRHGDLKPGRSSTQPGRSVTGTRVVAWVRSLGEHIRKCQKSSSEKRKKKMELFAVHDLFDVIFPMLIEGLKG